MITQLPDYPILIGRLALATVIWGLYTYDFVKAFDVWLDGNDRRGSDLRAVIRSFNLSLGLLIIVLGAVTAAFFSNFPVIRDALRFSGYVLLGTLFVGGIALAYSWWHERKSKLRRVA